MRVCAEPTPLSNGPRSTARCTAPPTPSSTPPCRVAATCCSRSMSRGRDTSKTAIRRQWRFFFYRRRGRSLSGGCAAAPPTRPQTIARRLTRGRQEARQLAWYDYCVVNEQLDEAEADLVAIIRTERARIARFAQSATLQSLLGPQPDRSSTAPALASPRRTRTAMTHQQLIDTNSDLSSGRQHRPAGPGLHVLGTHASGPEAPLRGALLRPPG